MKAKSKSPSMNRPKSQSPLKSKNYKPSVSPLPRPHSTFKIVSHLPWTPDNLQVHIRFRPSLPRESKTQCVTFDSINPNKIYIGLTHEFSFEKVYQPGTTNSDVFNESVLPNLKKAITGFTYTVMAYGQTSSGKTYTIGSDNNPGILQQSLSYVFSQCGNAVFKLSFIEIYLEKINDLLSTNENDYFNKKLRIRELNGRFFIDNLTNVEVQSYAESLNIIKYGIFNRKKAITMMNHISSRSHAIITLTAYDEKSKKELYKLNFVDLAGSERLTKSANNNNDRFKEGVQINAGLLALGKIIINLSQKNKHIPYRESKLTTLLKDSFTGMSMTTLISCVSPSETNQEETLSTLNYSSFAKKITFSLVSHKEIKLPEKKEFPLNKGGNILKTNMSISFRPDINIKSASLGDLESEMVRITKENLKISKENDALSSQIFDIHSQIESIEGKIKNCADIIASLASPNNEGTKDSLLFLNSTIKNKIDQLRLYQEDLNGRLIENERKNNFLIKTKNDELNFVKAESENKKKQIESKEKLLRLSHNKIAQTKNQIINLQSKIRSKTIEIDSIKMIKMKKFDINNNAIYNNFYKQLILKLDNLYRLKHKLNKQREMISKDKENFYTTMINNQKVLETQKETLLFSKNELEKQIKDSLSQNEKSSLISKLKSLIAENIKCKNRIEKFSNLLSSTLQTYEEKEKSLNISIDDINKKINQIKIDAVSNDGTSSGTLYQLEKENLEKDKKISRIEKQIKTQAFEYEIKLSCLKLQLNQEETLIKNKKNPTNTKHNRNKSA